MDKGERTIMSFPGDTVKYLVRYGGAKLEGLKGKVEEWIKSVEAGNLAIDAHHAVAVAKCLGTVLGLITEDHWLNAQLETYALMIYDILKYAERWYKETDKEKKMEMLDDLKKNILEHYFGALEKVVADNEGHFGGKLTWVDFFFVGAVEVLELYLGITIMEGRYPALLGLIRKILDLPEIRNWIDKEKCVLAKYIQREIGDKFDLTRKLQPGRPQGFISARKLDINF